jgi:hypothetical protein
MVTIYDDRFKDLILLVGTPYQSRVNVLQAVCEILGNEFRCSSKSNMIVGNKDKKEHYVVTTYHWQEGWEIKYVGDIEGHLLFHNDIEKENIIRG